MKKYPTRTEHISFGDVATRKRRARVCAARRLPYAWMRFDTCTELPDPNKEVPSITSSQSVSTFLHESVPFAGRKVEFFMVLCMDTKNRPIAVAVPHRGGRASMAVDPTVVLQAVILSGATCFIIAHNHPSEDPKPSQEDIALTQRLKEASKMVGVALFDHIVLTDYPDRYYSFTDAGILK